MSRNGYHSPSESLKEDSDALNPQSPLRETIEGVYSLCSQLQKNICTLLLLFTFTTTISAQEKQVWLPNFQQPTSSLYQVNMQYKENGFSSLLVIKSEGPEKYHLVFMTQFGLKLMEFILEDEKMEVIQVIEWMDRKILLNVIKKDLNLILFPELNNDKVLRKNETIIKVKTGKYKHFIKCEDDVYSIEKTRKRNRVDVHFGSYKTTVPEDIKLEHRVIKLTMDFELLEVK